MTAIEQTHGRKLRCVGVQPKGLPRWLWNLVNVSMLLSIIFTIRAVLHESHQDERAALMYSGVHHWAQETGVGEVLFCAADEEPLGANTHLVEGLIIGGQNATANQPNVYHWICMDNGTVIQAFNPTEWKTALARKQVQLAKARN